MATRQEDRLFGGASEDANHSKIEEFTGTKLNINKGYATMDYIDQAKTVFVELKTRRVRHNAYPTTIVGVNKISFCKDESKKYYFVFSFLDGLYGIKYDKELFNTFACDGNYFRKAREDCPNVQQSVIHIPVSKLTKIN